MYNYIGMFAILRVDTLMFRKGDVIKVDNLDMLPDVGLIYYKGYPFFRRELSLFLNTNLTHLLLTSRIITNRGDFL